MLQIAIDPHKRTAFLQTFNTLHPQHKHLLALLAFIYMVYLEVSSMTYVRNNDTFYVVDFVFDVHIHITQLKLHVFPSHLDMLTHVDIVGNLRGIGALARDCNHSIIF